MRATTEPVEGNLIRLSVEIEEPEMDRALDTMVKTLSRQVRVPGFRPGKVPRRVLEARLGGAGALRAEALREALPDFYAQAVIDADVDPIAPPEIDITSGQESGPVQFDAVVQVRPTVSVGGYEGLEVTVPSVVVTAEDVDRQIDRLRENDAELVAVDRPAVDDDHVTIDVHGDDDTGAEVVSTEDYLYEVGSGRVVPELDEHLRGAKVGDVLAFSAATPDGDDIAFRVLVKEVKEKKLPEPTDEWAAESSEFETVAELRADIESRLGRVKALQAQLALRQNALEALGALVDDAEVPDVLVDNEVQQRVHDLTHRLEAERLTIDQFLAATGRTGDDLVGELRSEAGQAVKADLALRALADAEGLVVTDAEVDAEVAAMAERLERDPADLRRQLDHDGRTTVVRSEQRKAKAMTWLMENVSLVDEEGNEVSRDDLEIDQGAEEGASGAEGEAVDVEPEGAEVTSAAGAGEHDESTEEIQS